MAALSILPALNEGFSLNDYLRREEVGEVKSQLVDGRIEAMSGASGWHTYTQARIFLRIGNHLEGRSCQVLGSDAKVNVAATREVFYPDVAVACPPRWVNKAAGLYDNPKIVVEVLSPSTRRFDRTTKFASYRTLDSLEEYVLLDPEARTAEVYRREEGWVREDAPETLRLKSVSLEIPVAGLFETD